MPDHMGGALRVVICVCTCQRPRMLQACLDALGCQLITPDIRPLILIIDNAAEPNNAAIAYDFEKTAPYEVAYWHEPMRGLAIARNTALHMALEFGAEWIAFLDDDHIAEPDWLANMMAPEFLYAPILVGHRFVASCGASAVPAACTQDNEPANSRTGAILSASNVRIAATLVRHGLRFDTTGSPNRKPDAQFFMEAERAGFKPHWTHRAIVTQQLACPEETGTPGEMSGEGGKL
jgi:succinoglycan biosynthesis protein ExoM